MNQTMITQHIHWKTLCLNWDKSIFETPLKLPEVKWVFKISNLEVYNPAFNKQKTQKKELRM